MRDGAKTMHSMIALKVLDDLQQNNVDELVRWQEQADSILVKVRIQIRPLSGIQNVNSSALRTYALQNAVPFRQVSLNEWFFSLLFFYEDLKIIVPLFLYSLNLSLVLASWLGWLTWDPSVLSSSPFGCWVNTRWGWLSLSPIWGRQNEFQCTGNRDTASAAWLCP